MKPGLKKHVLAAMLFLVPVKSDKIDMIKYLNVMPGHSLISNKILESEGFVSDSALAIDCGEYGFFAHVFSEAQNKDSCNILNIIEKTVSGLKKMNIYPKECTAYIHSGNEMDCFILKGELTNYGFRIARATYETDEPKKRKAMFSPKTDEFRIIYEK